MRWIGEFRREGYRYLAVGMAGAMSIAMAVADEPRLNQIQVIGTHNSYHIAPAPAIYELVASAGRRRAEGLDYSHRPLDEQLSQLGHPRDRARPVRRPQRRIVRRAKLAKDGQESGQGSGPDPAADGKLREPGFKVLHIQDVDFRTHTPTFVDALKQIRSWSRAHRNHVPIMIMIELKDEAIFGLSTKPVKFGRDEVDEVDIEILSVFDRSEILTPDRVRGRFKTLPEAIRAQGWPALDAVRGLVMFSLENENHCASSTSMGIKHFRAV